MNYFGITIAGTGLPSAVNHITGEEGSFSEGLDYTYMYGDNPDYSVDEITPINATPVFRSADNIVRVTSYQNRDYRTIASAIVFGALYDDTEHTKAELMNYYIRFLLPSTGNAEEVIPTENPILYPAYPNPFNPTTTISFSLPKAEQYSLKIYDIKGKLIDVVAEGMGKPGKQEFVWNGLNSDKSTVASGVYFARLQTSNFSKTTKLTLLK